MCQWTFQADDTGNLVVPAGNLAVSQWTLSALPVVCRKTSRYSSTINPVGYHIMRTALPEDYPASKRKRLLRAAMLAMLLAAISGCSSKSDPELQVRKMIDAVEEAVEQRSVMTSREFISREYKDSQGRKKEELDQLVAAYILRNKSIHLVTRVNDITFNEDSTLANVTLYVGMAGVPVDSIDQLLVTRADLHRFDLLLALEDDQWLLRKGSWHQAGPEDFGL